MAAISNWLKGRVYLALDTTMLWNKYCMTHLSIICGGRAIPFLWLVTEHNPSFVTLGLTFVKAFLESLFPLRLVNCQGFGDRQSLKANK